MFITPKVETNIAIQKTYYKRLASNMEFEDQTLLMERCRSQKWPGVTQDFSQVWKKNRCHMSFPEK